MLQLILLILGIIALVRLPRLIRCKSADYPEVDPAAFAAWRSTEKASTIWLLIASWGVLIVQIIAFVAVGLFLGLSRASEKTIESAMLIVTIIGVFFMLGMLIPAAIHGSKAKKLRMDAGILWPKKKT